MSNDSAKTMRIDIHPDFLGESLARKKAMSGTVYSPADITSYISRKEADRNYVTEYEKLLQSIYDAVMVTDIHGRVMDFNSRALDFFLCDKEQLSAANVIDLISGSDKGLLDSISNNLREHKYTLIEAHCVRQDKSMFPAEIAVNKIDLDSEGELCFFVRDISIRKRAQEALEEAVKKLEEHDRQRSQFVTNVSHELRTPLTSMTYAVTNMLRGVLGPIPERIRGYLQILDGDCKRLLGTVNDILDLRKIDDQTLTLSKARIPISRLVKKTMETLKPQAHQKNINLSMKPSEKKWFVDCDAQKVARVVLNLIGNAVKFTPDGGDVEVSVYDDPAQEGVVFISVRDTGIGIPPDSLDRVTERYFTVGEQPSGSGLGLAISREIIEMHSGHMFVESPPVGKGSGTEVTVSLPVVDAPTVLIVDDEAPVLSLLEGQVATQGYTVITASHGEEALEKVIKVKPNVVLLDMVLPGMDGTEVILKMKSDKELMRIPIIVVTGAEVGEAKAQILNSFSIPAISKPWEEMDLLDRVEGAFLGVAALT